MAGQHKGMSLHIGLNRIDPTKYVIKGNGGIDGALDSPEVDARDMEALAKAQGFHTATLLTDQATGDRIVQGIRRAADQLRAGDMFLLTFSGHGWHLPDKNGDEVDKQDEAWVAYDRPVIDDELYLEFARFAPGVRLVVVSDSCFSGTIGGAVRPPPGQGPPKGMPPGVEVVGQEVRPQQLRRATAREPLRAQVLTLSACKDDEEAYCGYPNSIFTGVLVEVWNGGAFDGDYRTFLHAIRAKCPDYQSPQEQLEGPSQPDLLSERPFTINPSPPHS